MHKLTDINTELRTARCSECGPVDIRKKGKNHWGCKTHYKSKPRTYKPRPDRVFVYDPDKWRMKAYKLSKENYEKMLADQNGCCAICGANEPLVVDHNHSCCPKNITCGDCVRELLCFSCNTFLGRLEACGHLEGMLGYLRKHSKEEL